jgi:two-component system, OmpR family, sensor histidine kinase BaeS
VRRPLRTLRGLLATTHGAVALVAVLVAGLYSATAMREVVLGRVAQDLIGEANVIADQIAGPLARDQIDVVRSDVARIDPRTTASILVLDREGRIVAASNPPPVLEPSEIGFAEALAGREVILSGSTAARDDLVQVTVPVRTDAGEVVGVISESYDFEDTRALVWRVNAATLAGGAVAAAVAATIGLVFATLVARPIGRAAASVRHLATYGSSPPSPAPAGATDEVRDLVRAVNQLADQLAVHEQARREFASDVSHELHALASAMQTAAHALARGAADRDPALARRFVAGLVSHTHRLGRLADDLLELARIEAGRLRLESETLDLVDLVEGVLDEWAAEAAERGAAVEASLPPGPLPLWGDPIRLGQALGNLVENALKYAVGAGRVRVVVERDAAAARYAVAVEDSGPGIPEEVLPRVFDRYFRVEGRAGVGPGGMGLGLAIARGIARAHGGDLVAGSAPGEGARFTLWLPVDGRDETPS